jgi:hypothetical protein
MTVHGENSHIQGLTFKLKKRIDCFQQIDPKEISK